MSCVYKITFPDGKSYIGISKTTALKRLTRHKWRAKVGSRFEIHEALRKYPDNFTITEIAWSADWNILCKAEMLAIKTYNTKIPNGYNMTAGGNGALGYRHTETSKRKMKGRKPSEANRTAVSIANRGNRYGAAANIGNKNAAGTRSWRTKMNIRIGKAMGKAIHDGRPFCLWKPKN